MERRPQLVIAVPSVLLAILAGAGAVSNVDLFLAWLNATPFGTTDPYFGLDVAFFIFHLPWWRFVVGQLIWTLIVALLAAAAVHFVTGSLRTSPMRVTSPAAGQSPEIKFSNPFTKNAQAHLSVVMGLIMLAIGVDQWLGRYVFSISDNDALFTGIGYTDDHARITAKMIMSIICLVCAIAFFINAKLRRWVLPTSAVALAVASSLIVQGAYPALVQQFDVRPNEPEDRKSVV